jgi:ubiquinone biosynthesis protein
VSRLQRLWKITRVTIKYRLDTFINADLLPLPLRWLHQLAPWRWPGSPSQSRGQRLRLALQELGPIFIKFGQMLSTRRDLLPADIADELAHLQDNVPPFSSDIAVRTIETALGKSVGQIFASFDPQPMASASIAQIHPASLQNGKQVVVKVVRPGIEKIIAQDIALLKTLAVLLQRFHPDGKRLRPVEVVEDYRHTIFDELDLQREAANTSQLRRNFIDSGLLYVPEVYWDYTRRNVFVMERIDGIPVTDIAALKEQNTDLKKLAERGVQIFFTQVFRDSFFHADMHPGNVFVSRKTPHNPQYIGIDCAIIGSLSEFDQYYLARNLLAIFHRDYRLVAELHVECGWVPPETRVTEFEAAIRTVCEPIFEKPLSEISFGQLLVHLFQTARRFDMEVQPSLVLLQKTLLNIEGLGRQLYPQLDLWQTAQPFLEEWLRERYSPGSILKQLKKYAPGWLEQLPQLPDRVFENLADSHQISASQQLLRQQQLQLEQQFLRDKRLQQQQILAGLILLTAAGLGLHEQALAALAQVPAYSWALAGTGLLLLIWRR